ncbi:MAG TPA: hypothetical protein VI037_10380 [Nitrososphaera sp.]
MFIVRKLDALTVATCLLNVRLVLHPEDVPAVHGKNIVVAGRWAAITTPRS